MIDKVKRDLQAVFNLIETIPVQGTHVESMAAVRAYLRNIYQNVDNLQETEESEDG